MQHWNIVWDILQSKNKRITSVCCTNYRVMTLFLLIYLTFLFIGGHVRWFSVFAVSQYSNLISWRFRLLVRQNKTFDDRLWLCEYCGVHFPLFSFFLFELCKDGSSPEQLELPCVHVFSQDEPSSTFTSL